MLQVTQDEVTECFALMGEAFDRRIADEERLPKVERVIELRERIGMRLDFTLYWVGRDGSRTPSHYRPYHREAERIRERMRVRALFGL